MAVPVDFSSAVVMAVCIGTSALGSVLLGATGFGPAIVFHVAIAVLEMWTHHIANDAVVITLITLPMCVTLLIITVLAWKDISWALYTLMVIPAALFIPVGTLLLLKLDPAPVRQGVGILVLAFAVYRFFFAVRLWDLNRRRRRAAQRAGGGSAGDGGAKPSAAGVASAVDSLLLHGDGQQGGFGTTTGGHDRSQCRSDGDGGGAAAVTGSDSVAISTDTEPAAPPALPTPAAANSGASASPWRSPPSPGSHRSQRSHRSHRFYRSPRGRHVADDRRRMSYGSAPRRVRSSASFDSGIVSRVGGSVSPGGGSAILRQRSGRWGSADGDWQWPGDEPAVSIFHTGPPAAPMKLADIPLLRVVCARVVACPCLCAWCPCRRCRPEACGWPSKGVMIGTVITGAWVGFLLGLVGIPGLPLMVLVTSLKMKKSVTRATVSAVLATVHPVQVLNLFLKSHNVLAVDLRWLYAYCSCASIVGLAVGMVAHRHISDATAHNTVLALLVVSASLLGAENKVLLIGVCLGIQVAAVVASMAVVVGCGCCRLPLDQGPRRGSSAVHGGGVRPARLPSKSDGPPVRRQGSRTPTPRRSKYRRGAQALLEENQRAQG